MEFFSVLGQCFINPDWEMCDLGILRIREAGGRWAELRALWRVYEPGFKEWVRCEYTEWNKHEQKCGARNDYQTQHSAGAQWMLTEWVYEWKSDFHGRQFEYQLDWHKQLRGEPKGKRQQHQILEGQAERSGLDPTGNTCWFLSGGWQH